MDDGKRIVFFVFDQICKKSFNNILVSKLALKTYFGRTIINIQGGPRNMRNELNIVFDLCNKLRHSFVNLILEVKFLS